MYFLLVSWYYQFLKWNKCCVVHFLSLRVARLQQIFCCSILQTSIARRTTAITEQTGRGGGGITEQNWVVVAVESTLFSTTGPAAAVSPNGCCFDHHSAWVSFFLCVCVVWLHVVQLQTIVGWLVGWCFKPGQLHCKRWQPYAQFTFHRNSEIAVFNQSAKVGVRFGH